MREFLRTTVVISAALAAFGCSSTSEEGGSTTAGGAAGAGGSGSGGGSNEGSGSCSYYIAPSGDDQTSVQEALINATTGETVCLGEGTFSFASELSLSTDGVTLQGAGRELTVLEFSAQDVGANGIQILSNDVTISDLEVRNTPGDGIRATEVSNVVFDNVAVVWEAASSLSNGAYGLYPVGCDGVHIENAVVTGARDAGIYVGQSKNIVVTKSEAYGNVAGIEIENSTDAEVYENNAHDNTGGILVFNLPNLEILNGVRTNVHDNVVKNNNLPNFAAEGTTVADVPVGTGILLLATDNNEVHNNEIVGNDSVGIAVISYLALLFGGFDDDDYNAFPTGNYIHDNTFEGNGTSPDALVDGVVVPSPVPDVLWDGCLEDGVELSDGVTNCLSNMGQATYYNANLCNDFAEKSDDPTNVLCEYENLPSSSE